MTKKAKAYFIGGGPRVGKTTIAHHIMTRQPMFSGSTDAIRASLRGVLSEAGSPALFKAQRGAFNSLKSKYVMTYDHAQMIEYQEAESEIVWNATLEFVRSHLKEGRNVLIEGIAILPRRLKEVDFDYKAHFVVDLNDHTQKLLTHAAANAHDWLHKYDEDIIKAFADFNRSLHAFYHLEALKYNLPVSILKNDEDYSLQLYRVADALLTD